jgi:DinB superfamily
MGTIQAYAAAIAGYKDKDFLLSHLEETRDEFLQSIRGLSETQWRFKAAPDRWSIAECAEHVALSEEYIRGAVQKTMNTPEATPAQRELANLTDDEWIERVMNRSGNRQSPAPLEPMGRWSSATEIEEVFCEARQVTVDYVKSISESEMRKHLKEAPNGTMLDAYQWMLLLTTHVKRHTLQIEEVKAHAHYPHS